uniref:Uncharacterized protein n=1 Tax=Macaca mulatta TaxID=9544 RepID=A0A5F7ZNI9_MACMU
VAGITGACHHSWLIFVYLVETRFRHVGQADLELLTSGDPPTSVSQSAGITGVSHCAQPPRLHYKCLLLYYSLSPLLSIILNFLYNSFKRSYLLANKNYQVQCNSKTKSILRSRLALESIGDLFGLLLYKKFQLFLSSLYLCLFYLSKVLCFFFF